MPKTLSPTSITYTLWPKERPKKHKKRQGEMKNHHLPLPSTTISSPLSEITQSTPSPTITAVELTAVKIIEAALVNHLNLQTPPPFPQPTIPLPTFPLMLTIPSPSPEPTVHIDDHDPSPFALRQPLPDSTLDSPIDYDHVDDEN